MEWGGVFNVARYLTDSLRGPVLQTLRRAHEVREFDGTDGLDGYQKCPLIFFILRYNKHYTHIVWRKFKDPFGTPSNPPTPTHQTRRKAPRSVKLALDPEGSLSGNGQ